MGIGTSVKQMNDLRKMRTQALKMQKELKKEEVSVSKGDVKVKVNGAQEIIYIEIEGEERKDVRDAINQAMTDVQKKAAQRMMENGGLGNLFGN